MQSQIILVVEWWIDAVAIFIYIFTRSFAAFRVVVKAMQV